MNDQEQRMVEYASQWMSYGGGDDEILAEFGLTPEQFYRRLLHLVSTRRVGGPNAKVRGQVGRFSSKKVAAYATLRTAPIRR